MHAVKLSPNYIACKTEWKWSQRKRVYSTMSLLKCQLLQVIVKFICCQVTYWTSKTRGFRSICPSFWSGPLVGHHQSCAAE